MSGTSDWLRARDPTCSHHGLLRRPPLAGLSGMECWGSWLFNMRLFAAGDARGRVP